ncbi:hypothetical protein [Aequorivita echinoideorum]|uniref:Uncharacterized protein n=1 Tax=Aequorivita echinoideorum TaxID=1549647 RepID=A0ABS5S0P2_9FLAO|nr:hypothetical protein [Aequorivita echinoideorum]MBT0606776.1 hypothetical protein [Aequorivita echinoideorum]
MHHRNKSYIKLSESVHKAVVRWDPLALISLGAVKDEYDVIENRFLSGLINSESNDIIIEKVKLSLEYLGIDLKYLESEKEMELEADIRKILSELKKHTFNNK